MTEIKYSLKMKAAICIDFQKIWRNGHLLQTQVFILQRAESLFLNFGNNRQLFENNVYGIGLWKAFKKIL